MCVVREEFYIFFRQSVLWLLDNTFSTLNSSIFSIKSEDITSSFHWIGSIIKQSNSVFWMFPCCPCCLCPVTALTLLYWHCCRSVTRDKTVSTMSYRYRPIVADSGEWQWQCEWSEQIPTEKENFAFPSLKQHKSYYRPYRHFIISYIDTFSSWINYLKLHNLFKFSYFPNLMVIWLPVLHIWSNSEQ